MKKRLLVLLFFMTSVGALAQDNMTQQAKGLVQSINLNPAARPTRGFLSIPIIGSFQVGVSNAFSYNDAFLIKSNGAKYINLPSIVSAATASGNSLMFNMNLDIVNVGFYVAPDDFVTIAVRARVHAATSYPLGMFEFISDNSVGNARAYNVNMSPSVLGWGEVAAGYSRSIDGFTVGARLKYIEGIAALNSPNGLNFNIDKQYDKYLLSADYALNVGGVPLSSSGAAMGFQYNMFKNPGFAVDLGVTWTSEDERISASASVSDLGRIWWNASSASEIRAKNPNQKVEYDGLGNLLQQGLNFGQLMDSVFTEFNNAVGVDTIRNVGFSTAMPTTFQAMGAYSLGRKLQHNLSLGFIGQLPYKGGFDYAVSVGYAYRSPNKVWQFMTNYTYRSNNPINIGLGVVMTAGPFQLYLATDNVLTMWDVYNARNATARIGLNFFFGPESVKN